MSYTTESGIIVIEDAPKVEPSYRYDVKVSPRPLEGRFRTLDAEIAELERIDNLEDYDPPVNYPLSKEERITAEVEKKRRQQARKSIMNATSGRGFGTDK
jgi:hypothetical protein